MLCDSYFKNPKDVPLLLKKIEENVNISGPVRLMEICGTHTMAIARSGIRSILPKESLSSPDPDARSASRRQM